MTTVLVGDVGGTNVRFGLGRRLGDGRIVVEGFTLRPANDYPTFTAALASFLETLPERPAFGQFAFAGPMKDGVIHLTNRPWIVSLAELEREFGFRGVSIANDFAAMARSAPELPADACEPIKPGEADPGAPIAVAGPGTGFGVGVIAPLGGGRWKVLPGEGGHVNYAPVTPLEGEVAEILRREHGYVSIELVLAGMGYKPVRRAVAQAFGVPEPEISPAEMLERAAAGDALSLAVCRLRAAGIMQACGNIALTTGALGGVVIAGGVAERLSPYLREPEALERFAARGPMSKYLAETPVRLIRYDPAPLIGAAALFFDRDLGP